MLIDAISATRRASEQLLQVLEDEFEALKRRDAERLVQLTAHKQTQTSATNDQFAAVQAILLQALPAPTPAGNDLMATFGITLSMPAALSRRASAANGNRCAR